MADGKALDITIPAGLKDAKAFDCEAKVSQGLAERTSGDALVEIHVKLHPVFRRDGTNIRSTLPVTPGEALGRVQSAGLNRFRLGRSNNSEKLK